jgi:hypothetical protein
MQAKYFYELYSEISKSSTPTINGDTLPGFQFCSYKATPDGDTGAGQCAAD